MQAFAFRGNLTYVFGTAGSFSNIAPPQYNRITVEAIGGGGGGFGITTTTARAGGGGGAYARTSGLTVVGGTTVVNILVGTTRANSWVNITANSQPTATTSGCSAGFGGNAASSVAGLAGNLAFSVGTITFAGGAGGVGTSAVGGGGAGFNGNASLQVAGTDTSTISPYLLMGGGTGGAQLAPGVSPGGGGGSDTKNGIVQPGAPGRVRITYWTA